MRLSNEQPRSKKGPNLEPTQQDHRIKIPDEYKTEAYVKDS